MLNFLASLDAEQVLVWGGGVGAGLTAIGAAWQGLRKGKPTSAAVAGAIEASSCRVMDLNPTIKSIVSEMHQLREENAELRDLLVRIEDRTRRS